MSEANAAAVTPTIPTAAPPPTIHDAIDALFAEKAKAAPTPEAAIEAAIIAPTEAATMEETEATETPTEPTTPAAPKVSASDYAIRLARAKKKLAAVKAAAPAPVMPSSEAIKRAAAIEAAGGNPLKIMEAAGIDLAAAVRAHENELAQNPEYHDPLAKEVKALAAKLAQYEAREKTTNDAVAVSSFFASAEKIMASSGDKFEFVAAHGAEGLEVVKELVLEAATKGEVLSLSEALKMAEGHYGAEADKLAKTKKLASRFQTPTRKPGIAQQATSAGAAPDKQTKPKSVSDVINNAIDALLG